MEQFFVLIGGVLFLHLFSSAVKLLIWLISSVLSIQLEVKIG